MKYSLLAIALLLPTAAFAGEQEAKACAATLSPDGQKIYAATAPHVAPGVELRNVLTTQVKRMVVFGQISRATARDNAQAAGVCLKELQS